MPARERSVSRCGAAVAGPRLRLLERRPSAPMPAGSASKERDALSKRSQADESGQCGARSAAVPALDAVVPGEPDGLRARAGRRDAEPEASTTAVEEPRAQVEAAELPPEGAALHRARVAPEAPGPAGAR